MRLVKAMAVLPPAALVLISGCAGSTPAVKSTAIPTSDANRPVEVQSAPSPDGQEGERVSAVEGRLNEMNQRLDKMGNQVQKLEGGVTGAQNKADAAQKSADGVDSRL